MFVNHSESSKGTPYLGLLCFGDAPVKDWAVESSEGDVFFFKVQRK